MEMERRPYRHGSFIRNLPSNKPSEERSGGAISDGQTKEAPPHA